MFNQVILIAMTLLMSCSFKGESRPSEIKLSIYNRSAKPIDSVYIDFVGRRKFYNPIKVNDDTTFVFDLKNYIVNDRETSFMAVVFQEKYHYPLGFGFQWMGEMDTTRHYHYYVFNDGINTKNVPPEQPTQRFSSSR